MTELIMVSPKIEIGKAYIDPKHEGVLKFIAETPNGMLLGYRHLTKSDTCIPILFPKGDLPNAWIEYREPRKATIYFGIYSSGPGILKLSSLGFSKVGVPEAISSGVPGKDHLLIECVEYHWEEKIND